MIRVRYPTGLVVTYNSANYLVRCGDNGWQLYEDSTKQTIVASIQNAAGAAFEFKRPCSVHTEGRNTSDLIRAVLNDGIEDLPGYLLADLKCRLQDFDARRRCWK